MQLTEFHGPVCDFPPCPEKKVTKFTNLLDPHSDDYLLRSTIGAIAGKLLPRTRTCKRNMAPSTAGTELAALRADVAATKAELEALRQHANVPDQADPEHDPGVKAVLQGAALRLVQRASGKPAEPARTEADRLADQYMAIRAAEASGPEIKAREAFETMAAEIEKKTGIRYV